MLIVLLGLPAIAAQGASAQSAGIGFADRSAGQMIVTAPGYRLVLSKRNGGIVGLIDGGTRLRLTRGSREGCLWTASSEATMDVYSACSYGNGGFDYEWDRASATLTMKWTAAAGGPGLDATVELTAGPSSFDLRLSLANHGAQTMAGVAFPGDLIEDLGAVSAAYAPTYLPGIRLSPKALGRTSATFIYPSRWAFADYLALDTVAGRLALYSANPPPAPIQPVELGFVHATTPDCSGRQFCLDHVFQTWLEDGATWTSPIVRVRVGATPEQSIEDYRTANGIDAYPSLADKLGKKLATFVRAPLVKADLPSVELPFRLWGSELAKLPKPSLVHPVSFEPGGHDVTYPDVLPPDPRWGTTEDFRAMVDQAHDLGLMVMPFTDPTFWTPTSPTVVGLQPPLTFADLAVQDQQGRPFRETYVGHEGYAISPYVPFVRKVLDQEMEQWQSEMAVDCVFFDQVGARPWLRDFNPASPTPLSYEDGWLEVSDRYADQCLMVEDGWDRLAKSYVGFAGSLLQGDRADNYPNMAYGAGNWQPYPLALWLLHDKVLLYQHALYDYTFNENAEVLRWNLAFGMMLSSNWTAGTIDDPWLGLTGRFQEALGPLYAGRPLTAYSEPLPWVTESVFGGDFDVVASWNPSATYVRDDYELAPNGFLARTKDGSVLAGGFVREFNRAPLSPGTHFVLVQTGDAAITVSQPVGDDTTLAIDLSPSWGADPAVRAVGYDSAGEELTAGTGQVRDGRFELEYVGLVGTRRVAYYTLSPG
jgi:hypothetical protein